jgi:peptidoglycan-associated lipoprotein
MFPEFREVIHNPVGPDKARNAQERPKMKPIQFIKLFALAVIVLVIATGCRKRVGILTPLPSPYTSNPKDQTEAGLKDPTTDRIKTSDGTLITEPIKEGSVPTAEFNIQDYNEDRSALAGDTVHFDFDSTVVKSSERSKVDAVAAALKSDTAAKLLIEGHCDERGTEEYNRSLGERRALALRESLASMGVDAMRIKTVSFGEDKPVATGHDESAFRQNRRGEFVLLHHK